MTFINIINKQGAVSAEGGFTGRDHHTLLRPNARRLLYIVLLVQHGTVQAKICLEKTLELETLALNLRKDIISKAGAMIRGRIQRTGLLDHFHLLLQ